MFRVNNREIKLDPGQSVKLLTIGDLVIDYNEDNKQYNMSVPVDLREEHLVIKRNDEIVLDSHSKEIMDLLDIAIISRQKDDELNNINLYLKNGLQVCYMCIYEILAIYKSKEENDPEVIDVTIETKEGKQEVAEIRRG
jgi:sigma54-dependent transcription regulator